MNFDINRFQNKYPNKNVKVFPNKIVNKFQDKSVPLCPCSKKNKNVLPFRDNNVILYLKNNAELCQSKQKRAIFCH